MATYVALDAAYDDTDAVVGALTFEDWGSDQTIREWVTLVSDVAPYEPGQFYKRELPCLLAALREDGEAEPDSLTAVIIDGYVWLDDRGAPGLGAHLYDALDQRVPVIGVAKNEFRSNSAAIEIWRGESERALYVTAAGVDPEWAARQVMAMHGAYRIPTLLRRVDGLSKGTAQS